MFDNPQSPVGLARNHLAAARGEQLREVDWATLSGDELLELLTVLETDVRQRAAVGFALVAELEARGVAAELGCASTAVLLSERLRIGRREAAGRVRMAAELGPRRAMSGESLPPRFPDVASAVAEGAISDRHAALICRTVNGLPDAALEQAGAVAATLVEHARTLNPDQLAVLTRTVRACLDPDGVLAAEHDHDRRRHATITTLPDGSGQLQACLTGAATAVWQTILNTLARPVPDGDTGEPDRRSPGQRRHDALLDAGQRLLRAGTLPAAGGAPATVLLTLTLDQVESRTGLVTTAHGGVISVPQALRIAAEADIVPVVLSEAGGVLGYGLTRRTASIGQRRALAARDRGCSFPGCDRPRTGAKPTTSSRGSMPATPTWTISPSPADSTIGNTANARGWTCHMTDGLPHWRPPRWIDPNAVQLSGGFE